MQQQLTVVFAVSDEAQHQECYANPEACGHGERDHERTPMQVVIFKAALAAKDDGSIVIAFFDGDPMRCVALVKGSTEAASALLEALGSVLSTDET